MLAKTNKLNPIDCTFFIFQQKNKVSSEKHVRLSFW